MSKWIAIAAIAACGSAAAAYAQHANHVIKTPAQMAWGAGPPSLPAGARAMVLYGDPTKEGMFVMRLRLPAGYAIPPHTHPRPEIVTVISGAFHLGTGNRPIRARARMLPAGSFFALEPGTVHYAHTRQPTVVQISSTGPWAINYVNPADDPRKR
jgi:quercetin dioxygenase-like cupin family protein